MVQRQMVNRQMVRQQTRRQTLNRVAGKPRQPSQQEFKQQLAVKKFIAGKVKDSEKQLQELSKFKTYKGANSSFGQRIFSKSPQYYNFNYGGDFGGSVRIPYFVGTYKELVPSTGEIVTRTSEIIRYSSRGYPIVKNTVLAREKLIIPTDEQADKFNNIASKWKYAGNYSKDAAIRDMQKRQAIMAKKVQPISQRQQELEEFSALQKLRVELNKRLPKGYQVTSGQFKQIVTKENIIDSADVLGKALEANQKRYINSSFATNLDNKNLERSFDNTIRFITNPTLIQNILYR